ncbi:malate synthase [Bacillus salacetis]|uniref:Malate synthase n=1 Tax=Bacillus salacetis TaxID=2315464 RepID=A0A3A1R4L7_9BACI|nr:malate synthase [Bacillus salacetis]RIW34034.1 malate synthase [Bacillus salacetis]
MNLINKKVTHKRFGMGSIVNHSDAVVEIHFASESKKFVYPDVFGKHLKLHDEKIADSLEKILHEKEMELKEEERKKEEEKELQRKYQELRLGHEKLMKNHTLHPESQMVSWCDAEERNTAFSEWKVSSGVIKSGNNKGKPNKPIRLHQNSAVLLTAIDSDSPEKDREILGVYMVKDNFIGKLCEDGNIPAHSEYRLQLTEEESAQMPFWKYYANEKSPLKTTWNTGKYRYFDNSWMAQILRDIVSLRSGTEEQELAQQFLDHFCKMNQIVEQDLPEPNGALLRA